MKTFNPQDNAEPIELQGDLIETFENGEEGDLIQDQNGNTFRVRVFRSDQGLQTAIERHGKNIFALLQGDSGTKLVSIHDIPGFFDEDFQSGEKFYILQGVKNSKKGKKKWLWLPAAAAVALLAVPREKEAPKPEATSGDAPEPPPASEVQPEGMQESEGVVSIEQLPSEIEEEPEEDISHSKIPESVNTSTMNEHEAYITEQFFQQGFDNIQHLAYILATAKHETGNFQFFFELSKGKGKKYGEWYGRGYGQLTWEKNYIRMNTFLHEAGILTGDESIVEDKDLAARADVAAYILVRCMMSGEFTDVGLPDFTDEEGKLDFYKARRTVNGSDNAKKIAGYAGEYLEKISAPTIAGDVSLEPE